MTRAVEDVLLEIGADAVPQILVLAKADRIDDERRAELEHRHPGAVLISAVTGEGLDGLEQRIEDEFARALPGRRAADPVRGGRATRRAARDRRRSRARGHARRSPRAGPPAGVGRRALPGIRAESPVRVTQWASAHGRLGPRLDGRAVLPTRAYPGDAGLDLYALEERELGPGERASIGTGIAVEIPDGQAGLVLPRSGLAARHGIAIVERARADRLRLPGRGPRAAAQHRPRRRRSRSRAGDRIAQLVLVRVETPAVVEVDALAPQSAAPAASARAARSTKPLGRARGRRRGRGRGLRQQARLLEELGRDGGRILAVELAPSAFSSRIAGSVSSALTRLIVASNAGPSASSARTTPPAPRCPSRTCSSGREQRVAPAQQLRVGCVGRRPPGRSPGRAPGTGRRARAA